MEINEGAGRLVVKASRDRDVQRPAQVAGPVAAQVGNRAALGVERVAEHIGQGTPGFHLHLPILG